MVVDFRQLYLRVNFTPLPPRKVKSRAVPRKSPQESWSTCRPVFDARPGGPYSRVMTTLLGPNRRAFTDPHEMARAVVDQPPLLAEVLDGLSSETARTKFGCAKAVRLLSETHPELLYPKFDFFVRLLDHPNKILQWEATLVLSQLAGVDAGNKFQTIFEKYFGPIGGPVMITAANVIRGAARIARAKPQWADRIAAELLKVAKARYQTPECRNVAIGHAVLALGEFVDLLANPAPVVRFVKRQLKNSRPATRNKAEGFLGRMRKAQ